MNRKIFNFNLFELWLLLYFLCQRIILKGYRLAKRDLMFATLKYISSHLVWLKKMTQIQIIVLKLIPRQISFLSTNILSPSLFQLNLIQRFYTIVLFFLFHSPSSARKFSIKYCHKSKQVLASSVMNTTFNFLSEKGLCPTTETDRKWK